MIVDRTETTGTLALASRCQAVIAVGLAFADPVWLVVALSFLLGSAASVASPAVFAIVPTAVDEEDLTEANANMETVRYIGMVAGPLIAGGLAGALGADKGTRVALLLDAITFLVITSAAASLRVRRMPEPAPEEGRTKGEARRGFAFIRRDRVLLIGVAVVAFAVLFATMDNVAEVFFANDPSLLNAGNWGYGELAAVWLLGMVIGAGFIARRLHQEQLAPAVLLASITGGAAVAVAALFPHIVLALAMFAVGGVANGVAERLHAQPDPPPRSGRAPRAGVRGLLRRGVRRSARGDGAGRRADRDPAELAGRAVDRRRGRRDRRRDRLGVVRGAAVGGTRGDGRARAGNRAGRTGYGGGSRHHPVRYRCVSTMRSWSRWRSLRRFSAGADGGKDHCEGERTPWPTW